MAKDFKSDFFAYLGKHNKSSSWSVYYTSELFIICKSARARTTILAQLLYLCDKGKRKDGFFYKSHKELSEEAGVSRRSIIRAIDWFEERGFLETKIRKVNSYPTSHYRIDKGKLFAFGRTEIKKHNKKIQAFQFKNRSKLP